MQATPSNSAKSTASVKASTKRLPTTQPASSTSSSTDPNGEIEEISKKISEHADAIYRTWKCRGLAPTELLEFYTNATAETMSDFFAATTKVVGDDTASTEGLQKLVSTFVIKDKEQRGVATAKNKSTIAKSSSLASDSMAGKVTPKSAQMMKQTKPVAAQKTATSAILLKPDESVADAKMKKIAKTTTSSTSSSSAATSASSTARQATVKNNACVKIVENTQVHDGRKSEQTLYQKKLLDQGNCTSAVGVSSSVGGTLAKTKSAVGSNAKGGGGGGGRVTTNSSPSADIKLNFDLDLENLTQLQTQNLIKIKELLQQENTENAANIGKVKKPLTHVKLGEAKTPTATTTPPPTTTSARTAIDSAAAAATKSATKTNDNLSSSSNKKIAKNHNVVGGGDLDLDVVVAAIIADKNSSGSGKRCSTTTKVNTKSSLSNEQQQQNCNHHKTKDYEDKTSKNTSQKVVKAATKENSSASANCSNGIISNNGTSHNGKTIKEKSDKKEVQPQPIVGTGNVMEIARSSMPAPTKAKSGRPLTNGQDKNLGRPILTRGSVAERVMMFEKCPDARNSFLNIKRPDPADAPPKSLLKVKLHATPPQPTDSNSLQNQIRSSRSVYIPRFYFPHGKPQPNIALERTLRNILGAFDSFPNNQVTKDELPRILKLCGLPFYWRMPIMVFCQQANSGLVERMRFVEFWKQMNVYCHDAASRFVYILSRGQRFRSYILPEDMAPLVQDVVDTHPGLAFLKEATEFHSRYVHTVIARIFYSVNRSWSGKISIAELKKSDLLEIIGLLEEEDDINQIMAFFSYEHFYVIYCKFWELDKDHDLLINQDDLARHSDHALSTRIVERIFSGCVTRNDNKKNPDDEPKMSYTDFVWFLLSEEDKRTPTAIEYWFRCMDVDGDGVLSMYELEYFYEEQQQRMESIGIETLPFEDCLCQMLDMLKPQNSDCVTLGDLKRCKMTHVFFDTFFNLEKYLDHEQRDPFASQRDEYLSDWDRFAAQEYELLITEENE